MDSMAFCLHRLLAPLSSAPLDRRLVLLAPSRLLSRFPQKQRISFSFAIGICDLVFFWNRVALMPVFSLQVYSFVPIPGAQQHKRPRRRYEEIERMYKCGWNGCEKAYGTLNHLNAHVTMQSHGAKRTPEGEFCDRFFLLVGILVPLFGRDLERLSQMAGSG